MDEVRYTGNDITDITGAATRAVNAMNDTLAELDSIIANLGLEGDAGQQMQAQLNEAKNKAQIATEKIEALKSESVGKETTDAEKDAKIVNIANS